MSLIIQVMPVRNASGFDTNLFYLFDAIARHGSVTRAAAELGISQGAASKGLNKLRILPNQHRLQCNRSLL